MGNVSKRILAMLLCCTMVFTMVPSVKVQAEGVAVFENTDAVKAATSIKKGKLKLAKTEGVLLVDERHKINVLQCTGSLKYSTSDSKVAQVDQEGNIFARGEGSATITVKDSKTSVKLKLQVVDFDFNPRGTRLSPGEKMQINITRGENSADYSWVSDNTKVAKVDKKGNVTAVVGKGGKANIRLAVKTLNGTSYSVPVEIKVTAISDLYTVQKTKSKYKAASGKVNTSFSNGQKAEINLVEGGLQTAGCDGDAYWHNTGLSTVYYKGYNYYFVTDSWNNRVLVYKVPKNVVWGSKNHSVLDYLYCVLGQTSTSENKAGYELNELNWPIEAATAVVDKQLKVYVTDANNNRILVWENLFSIEKKMNAKKGIYYAPSADYSIMEKCDVKNVVFHEGDLSDAKMSNESEAGIKWPWAIWTDGKRLLCTSTQDGCLMVWDSLPSKTEKYPDKLIYMGGTIRTIACKDNYLLLGDHNIDTGSKIETGLKIIKDYEALSYKSINNKNNGQHLFDYAEIGLGDGKKGYAYYVSDGHQPSGTFLTKDVKLDNGKKLKAGTLLLNCVGSIQVRTDGTVDGNKDAADYFIGGGVVEDTDIFRFTSADYAPVIVDYSGNLYVSMGNTGIIAGYKAGTLPAAPKDVPKKVADSYDYSFYYRGQYYETNRDTGKIDKHSTVFPNVWIGAKKVTDDAYKCNYMLQNNKVASDGEHLVAASDHGTGSVLMLWKNIPGESNALPDTIYTFKMECVMDDVAIYNDGKKSMLMAGGRAETLLVWKDINKAIKGEEPDIFYNGTIGNVKVQKISSFAYDGKYFYLCDSNGVYIYKGLPKDGQAPVSTLDYRNASINVTNCDDGETYIGLAKDDKGVRIYTRKEALKNGKYYSLKGAVRETVPGLEGETLLGKKKAPEKRDEARFNGVSDVLITKEGKVIVADTAFYRVLIWDSIQDAVEEGEKNVRKASTIELGYGADYYDAWDVLKADPSNYYHAISTDEISMESPTTLFRPDSVAYDGSYLWIADFKFSGGIKRFSGKF